MNFYIKEWPDRTASLMTAAGQRLFTFKSIDSAMAACGDWYGINKNRIIPTLTTKPHCLAEPIASINA